MRCWKCGTMGISMDELLPTGKCQKCRDKLS